MTDDPAKIKAIKEEIEAAGVQVIGYGVVHLGKDEAANRKIFEFAKAMGFGYLSVDPDPAELRPAGQAGRGIRHPDRHPQPRARPPYAMIDTIAKAIKDHSPKIGCCIDTGHFLRSKEDPVRAAEVFGKRVYGVHLKDVKNAETFTILGQGDLRTVDLLKTLAANKYGYCLAIEYEEKPENPIEDIKACLAETRKAVAVMGTA